MDRFISSLVIVFVNFLILLPYKIRLILFHVLFKLFYAVNSKIRKVALVNLNIVFPEKTSEEKDKILVDSQLENARFIADYLEIPRKSKEWFVQNIDYSEYFKIKDRIKDKPCLFISGHLGSFEYLLYSYGLLESKVAYIARSFKQDYLDNWWNSIRQGSGNVLIPRKGATRLVLQHLNNGKSVGFLFDQNITREKAVFVPWFGVEAATTKTLSLAVLETKVPVILMSLSYIDNKYKVVCDYFDFSELVDSDLSLDEKKYKITLDVSSAFERHIKAFPSGWFWMHSRWRTRKDPNEESLYK